MNFNLHFGELYSNKSINDKNNLFENYILKFYKVKRMLISFYCFSEYILGVILGLGKRGMCFKMSEVRQFKDLKKSSNRV